MESPLLDALEAQLATLGPGFRGFRGRHRIEATADGEFAGLWIEVDDMTVGEVQALRRNARNIDLWRLAAPLVLAWNVEVPVFTEVAHPQEEIAGVTVPARTVVEVTGWERPDPPAVAGADAFLRLFEAQPETVDWIVRRLRGFDEEGDDLRKKLLRLVPTPAGGGEPSAPATPDGPSPTPDRSAPTPSTTPSPSTPARRRRGNG